MSILRIILICVFALAPLGMTNAGALDGDQQILRVDCHEMMTNDTEMPDNHCSGMNCCIFTEQFALAIYPAGEQMRIGYTLEVREPRTPAPMTRPDKPPSRFF